MNWLLFAVTYCSFTPLVYSWGFAGLWDEALSIFGERCTDYWIPKDVEGFRYDIRKQVFGQPFLEKTLIPVLKRHMGIDQSSDFRPKKALVLSFHGSPGVGKTFTSQIIAKYLFKEADKSRYYKLILRNSELLNNEDAFRKSIIDTVGQCERALFVFDEIEKYPPGILDVIKSFLDYHTHINKIDYRKSIFIFVSNVGMDRINELSLSLWKQGIMRENYNIHDFSKVLLEPIYNERSGLTKTNIVKNFLIDLYIPFLPLEESHVKKCIEVEAEASDIKLSDHDIENILGSMTFLPPEERLFAASGCKLIDNAIISHAVKHDEL